MKRRWTDRLTPEQGPFALRDGIPMVLEPDHVWRECNFGAEFLAMFRPAEQAAVLNRKAVEIVKRIDRGER